MKVDVVGELGHLALGTRMKRVGERLQAQVQEILDAHGFAIQSAQFPFLVAVSRLGAVTVGDLAAAVGVIQPVVTKTVGQLLEAGFVEVAADRDDQRRKEITLTRAGKALVAKGKRDVWPLVERAVADLCRPLSGPLLEQLAVLEERLGAKPLAARTGAGGKGKP